jgi:hypothetical protein
MASTASLSAGSSSSSGTMEASSDALWKAVMAHFSTYSVASGAGASGCCFREISPGKAGCYKCASRGGGALVACCFDKCKRECHVECGFKCGGFFLNENNDEIQFFCESHFKPVTFCVCQRPYDMRTSAAMVCCEECIEWFHFGCVNLSNKAAGEIDHYVCKSCSQLTKQGKKPSPALIQANLEKEKRSAGHQDACRSINLLVEVAETMCPLIDQLNYSWIPGVGLETDNPDRGTFDGDSNEMYSPDQMIDAVDYLSGYPFVVRGSGGQDQEQVDFLGTLELISSWRERLLRYKIRYNSWLAKLTAFITSIVDGEDYEPTLSSAYVEQVDHVLNQLHVLTEDWCQLAGISFAAASASRMDSYCFVVSLLQSGFQWYRRLIEEVNKFILWQKAALLKYYSLVLNCLYLAPPSWRALVSDHVYFHGRIAVAFIPDWLL